MTISPEPPKLEDIPDEPGYKVLAEPHLTFVEIALGYSLMVHIDKGFVTDGASVPNNLLDDPECGPHIKRIIKAAYPNITTRYDFESLFHYLVGKPFDMPRLLAAIVHDALYGCKWKWRWICDKIYRWILLQNHYSYVRADIEYSAIRLAGWRNWNAVTDLERDRTRELVRIEFVRTKKIEKLINKMIA